MVVCVKPRSTCPLAIVNLEVATFEGANPATDSGLLSVFASKCQSACCSPRGPIAGRFLQKPSNG
jgi:hypothetical protein